MTGENDRPAEPILNPSGSASIRGAEEVCNSYGDRNSDQSPGQYGSSSQIEQIGASRTVGEGIDIDQSIAGEDRSGKKLIDQLEAFFARQLAYVEAHGDRLKARLEENQEEQRIMKEQFERLKQSLLQLVQETTSSSDSEQ